jgi:hypothetical protein
MQRTLVTTLGLADQILARRAADALRDLDFPAKNPPLRALLLNIKAAHTTRTSALRALKVDARVRARPRHDVKRPTDPVGLRRAAADQLALPAAGPPADRRPRRRAPHRAKRLRPRSRHGARPHR